MINHNKRATGWWTFEEQEVRRYGCAKVAVMWRGRQQQKGVFLCPQEGRDMVDLRSRRLRHETRIVYRCHAKAARRTSSALTTRGTA